ncbi:MAG: ABC transporter ATP-binding protein [Acidobacteria bacterium]|nr:MAG: ABC transporter ATP-binding protein [Acidobacteriota bacterium]
MAPPLLEVRRLSKEYRRVRAPWLPPVTVRAVDDVSFEVARGEAFGLVGESGSGKTTVARCIARLVTPTSGEVRFDGRDLLALRGAGLRAARRDLQLVFQDPGASLNPRIRVGRAVEEPLVIHRLGSGPERRARVAELFRLVGLDPSHVDRYPAEFSGGQRQRIALARALALNPSLVIADEPVSALDASIQAQVLDLFVDLRDRLNLTYLFIAHDLRVVRRLCARVAVMHRGGIVEAGPTEEVLGSPRHPYTQELVASEPKSLSALRGLPPSGFSLQ